MELVLRSVYELRYSLEKYFIKSRTFTKLLKECGRLQFNRNVIISNSRAGADVTASVERYNNDYDKLERSVNEYLSKIQMKKV